MLYAIVAVIALILDQAVKYWTTSNIALNTGTKELIPHIVHLANVHNTGAAFSFLQGARWFFVALCVLFVAIVIYLLAKNIIKSQPARWMAVLVMAGGIGNCIDRIVCGYVVDMFELSFKIFGRSFPVFNVADIFITVCGILFCIFFLLEPVEDKEKKPDKIKKAEKAARPASSPARAESAPVKAAPVKAAAPVRSAASAKKHRKIEIPDFPQHPRVEQPEIDPNDPFAEWERIVNKDSGSAAPVEASEAAEPAAPVEPAAPAVPVEVAEPAEPAETAEPAEVAAPAVPDAFFASIHSDDSSDFSSYIAAELAAIKAEASEKKSEPAAEAEAPQETVVFSPAAEPADEPADEADEDDETVDDVFSFFGRQKKDKAPKEAKPAKKDLFAELKAKAEKVRPEKPKAEKEAVPVKAEAPKAPKAAPRHAKSDGKSGQSAESAEAVREELSSAAESFDVESLGEESYRLEDILEEFKDL